MTKKFALILFFVSALLNIALAVAIIDSNNKTAERLAKVASLEPRVADLEKEVLITPDQIKLSPNKVAKIIADAKKMEGVSIDLKLEPSTKVSRQLFMQGLFYPIFQQFHGADKFSLENRLPDFRQMQWAFKLRTNR
ncbi:MAG: hypothetical protein Q8R29_00825 [bacterium]|nr:hypothetical protein [bacterium]